MDLNVVALQKVMSKIDYILGFKQSPVPTTLDLLKTNAKYAKLKEAKYRVIDDNYKSRKNRTQEISWERDCYAFIPVVDGDLIKQLTILDFIFEEYEKEVNKEISNLSFIDAGCGIGNAMFIVETLYQRFNKIHGVEIDEELVKEANELGILKSKCKIFSDDIRKFDFSNYDVIYLFCPMKNWVQEEKFESKLMENAKRGTIFITVFPSIVFNKIPYITDQKTLMCGETYKLHQYCSIKI